MLELEGAGLRRQGRWLCKDISLKVSPGELVALVGPNGAGKSTLLSLLAADQQPDQGRLILDGHPLRRQDAPKLARRRAVMLQHTSLFFGFSVEEVVELGLMPFDGALSKALAYGLMRQAMQLAGIERLRQHTYMNLSGGERQRVQFARALVQFLAAEERFGRYLLLDEPTSSLDLAHAHALLFASRALTRHGAGALVVLHDLNLAARYADRVVVLEGGQLVADGEPSEVFSERMLREVFGLRATIQPRGQGRSPLIIAHGAALDPDTTPFGDEEDDAQQHPYDRAYL